MISVLIGASEDAEALATLLTALVPAAAEGVVREALVVGASGLAAEVAEDAGADLCADFAQAAAAAKGPWLVRLPMGVGLAADWRAKVSAHMERAPAKAARLVLARRLLFGRAPEGWIALKGAFDSAGGAAQQDFERLARRSRLRLKILSRR